MLLVVVGAGLRLWQYFANSSLWMDEAALARNIVERSTASLLQPLDYAQAAPPGFLLVEKAIAAILGPSELALRLFPLVCGLGALLLFSRLAFTLLEEWAATYAVGLFAIGSPFIYFSSQVKQYSSDTFCALLVTLSALWMRRQPERFHRSIIVALVGAAVVWISHPAVIVVAGTGMALAACALAEKSRTQVRSVLVVGVVWILGVAAAGLFAMQNVTPMDRTYFDWFWGAGFWPWPPRRLADIVWPFRQLTLVFGTFVTGPRRTNGGLNYPWSSIFALVVLIGYAAFWRTRRDAALLLLTPAIVALIASAFLVYPFAGRLMMYLLPGFLLALAAGARFLIVSLPEWLSVTALALLGGVPLYAAATALPPERIEHIRPVLADLAARRDGGEKLYLHHSAGQAFLYYAPRFGFRQSDYVVGSCSAGDPRGYLRQVDRFRGSPRVWIVGTHLYYPPGAFQWTADYLAAIGRRMDSIAVEASTGLQIHGAYAFMYDLSDAGRLKLASADSFPMPALPVYDAAADMACYGVESPLRTLRPLDALGVDGR